MLTFGRSPQAVLLLKFLIILLALDAVSPVASSLPDDPSPESPTTATTTTTNVTVIGLGGMGRAIASCLASKSGIQVHAWNRGEENREILATESPNIVIHKDLASAIEASSSIIFMVVVADRGLKTATSLIESVEPSSVWEGKTIVQYTTHEPVSIQRQADLLHSLGASSVIGGAIVAVPHMVCTKHGTYLVSSNDDEGVLEPALPMLEHLGLTTIFQGNNVGYAALAYFGLIQSLQFGLAGHELGLLLMKKYGASQTLIDTYTKLIQTNVPMYFQRFTGLATKAVTSSDYESLAKSFLPADAYMEIMEMHLEFVESMGLRPEDTYLYAYLQVFRRVKSPETVGPTALVEYYQMKEDGSKDEVEDTGKDEL